MPYWLAFLILVFCWCALLAIFHGASLIMEKLSDWLF